MRPRRWTGAAAATVAVILLGACGSSLRVASRGAADVVAPDGATWDWYPAASLGVHDARVDTTEVSAIIRSAIVGELAAKGYRRDSTAPDFLVDFHGKLEQKRVELIVRPYCPGDPEPPITHQEPYCREYEEGTLTIHVLEARGGSVIWTCEARDEVDFTSSAAERRRRLEDAVRQILRRFPD